ncbi:MAG: DUF1573 domain-containing protein [Saprospiraceae bacterium]|nr:DUF1573 domain-containing protein [Saprospiraceae bacterium]
MKRLRMSFSVALLAMSGLIMVSCQNDGGDAAKEEAKAAIENTGADAVATSDNAVPTPAADQVPTGPTTSLEFAETRHDYGAIEQGEKVAHIFKFTNTGNEALVLSNVKPSCGCTTPSWTKEPVAPGESGEIHVEFDSKGKSGKQTKTVTVTANTDPAKTVLTISGEVQKPEEAG